MDPMESRCRNPHKTPGLVAQQAKRAILFLVMIRLELGSWDRRATLSAEIISEPMPPEAPSWRTAQPALLSRMRRITALADRPPEPAISFRETNPLGSLSGQ